MQLADSRSEGRMTEEQADTETNPLARKTPATRVGDPSLYASVNDIAAQAIKSVFIANGGGVLVLLAFFGSVWNSGGVQPAPIVVALAPSIAAFLAGVAFAILASFISYVSVQTWTNYHFSGQPEIPRLGLITNAAAVIIGLASLVAFIVGAWFSATAFSGTL